MKGHTKLLAGAACLAALILPACSTEPYGPGYAEEPDQLVIFEGANFAGASMPVNGALPDLVEFRFNDAASSIAVNFGTWEVCEDVNFSGHCEVIDANVPDLKYIRMNDNITSIRPLDERAYPPRTAGIPDPYGEVVIYSGTHMRGDALPVSGDAPDLVRTGFNDRARRVEIRAGVWQLCTDDGYRGRCEFVDTSVSDLGAIGLSGSLSSLRPLPERPYAAAY